MGELAGAMGIGTDAVWDGRSLLLKLYSGHLSSKDDATVLAGGNRIAVLSSSGAWEVLGFGDAELVSPGVYRLNRLLRGQGGTVAGAALSGAAVLVLDESVARLAVPSAHLGEAIALRVYAGPSDVVGQALTANLDLGPLLPLAPVHLRAMRDVVSGDIAISWIRRSRADSNDWALGELPVDYQPEAYQLTILNGGIGVRTVQGGAPSAIYTLTQQIADFGGAATTFAFQIAQTSPVFGPGKTAQGVFHG
jgi:hypothetical protein